MHAQLHTSSTNTAIYLVFRMIIIIAYTESFLNLNGAMQVYNITFLKGVDHFGSRLYNPGVLAQSNNDFS